MRNECLNSVGLTPRTLLRASHLMMTPIKTREWNVERALRGRVHAEDNPVVFVPACAGGFDTNAHCGG